MVFRFPNSCVKCPERGAELIHFDHVIMWHDEKQDSGWTLGDCGDWQTIVKLWGVWSREWTASLISNFWPLKRSEASLVLITHEVLTVLINVPVTPYTLLAPVLSLPVFQNLQNLAVPSHSVVSSSTRSNSPSNLELGVSELESQVRLLLSTRTAWF